MDLLKPVAYFFTFLYALLTLGHIVLLEDSFKWILSSTSLFTAIFSLLIGLNSSKVLPAKKSLAVLSLLLLGTINSQLHLWLSAAPEQTTNIFVAIIASGIVLSNRTHWVTAIMCNWLAWAAINMTQGMALTQHFFFGMAMSTLLSWFAHLARINLVEKHRELLEERDLAVQHEQSAQAATEAKSLFLANMSHEIRTPLNGVVGMIDLVSDSKLDTQQKDYMATAKRSAKSLQAILNDILDFSKIEADSLLIENTEFNLSQLFYDIIHDQQFQANKKGLTLILKKNNSFSPQTLGDPLRLTQVMNNLLSNAIKFTDSGNIIVEYELATHDNHLNLNVAITDSGIGICETSIPHLFDSFTQADMSTTRNFGGTGLGLAITKQLCQLMGGDISVKSKLSEGSTFRFSIQLSPTVTTNSPAEIPSVSASNNVKHLNILLVEDNVINQEVVKAILQTLEVKVEVANDGLEALAKLSEPKTKVYNLVLMDCQMPNLDGYETTRRIRAGEAGKSVSQIPVIALTANTLNNEQEKCHRAGMDDYIAKPINRELLQSTLAKYAS